MNCAATTVLVIEDENTVREGLIENLKLEGYAVVSADNGVDGLKVFEEHEPDLVVLDLMIPGLDGFEVCRRIRAGKRYAPIIMLTAKCSEVDKVVGLELGADDYLTKPFGMRELFARIKALLRRAQFVDIASSAEAAGQAKDELSFDDVYIDFRTYSARRRAAGPCLGL